MKPTLLAGAIATLLVGSAPATFAQHKAPLTQPNSEAAAVVPDGELTLGTVKVPKGVKADGKELPAGLYKVRLTAQQAEGKATGATPSYERYVEFLQGTTVKGREVVSIVPSADVSKVAKDKAPAPGTSRVQKLKGDDYVRVWINRGGNHYLIHLTAG